MESSLKKIDRDKRELTVELGREDLLSYIKQTEDRIAGEVRLDGFRKGKAPRDSVRKEVGDQYILQEALDLAVQGSLARTIEKENLDVLKASNLNVKENSPNKLVYTVVLSVFPPIKFGNLSGLKFKREEVSVNREDIDKTLDYLVASRSKFISKAEPAQKGDRVEIDFEITLNGLPIEGGVSKNHPFIIGDSRFIPGFEEEIIGMRKSEQKTFSLVVPRDYLHKNIAGKKLDFAVKLIDVQEIQRPKLDDNFARSIGRFRDLNDLEQNISAGVLEDKRIKERQKLRQEILSGILARSEMNPPLDMIDEQVSEMIVDFDERLHEKGMELSLYLTHLGKTEDDLRKDWRPEAERQVAFTLIVRKLAKDHNIIPSPEEIQKESERMVQAMILRGQTEQTDIDTDKLKEAVVSSLTNEKVMEFLEKKYTV